MFYARIRTGGLLSTGSSDSVNTVVWNGIGMGVLVAYYFVTSTTMFMALEKCGLFRVHPKDEIKGLDQVKHNEKAYEYCKFQ